MMHIRLFDRIFVRIFLLFCCFSLIVLMSGCPKPDDCPECVGLGKLMTDKPSHVVIFSNPAPGRVFKESFLLYNPGRSSIQVTSLLIVDDKEGAFKVLNPLNTPFNLSPGKDNGKKIELEFSPMQTGSVRARLRFASADADNTDENGHFYVRLDHYSFDTGEPVWECRGTINFTGVEKGRTETKECTLNNRGSTPLTIHKVTYKKEKGGQANDFKWVSPTLPVTIPAGSKNVVTVSYSPSDYPPREDQGALVLDTNIRVDQEADKPRLKVVGLTSVALLQLIPRYPVCKDNGDCRLLDVRLYCVRDAFFDKRLCLQRNNRTPFMKFPSTPQGEVATRTFWIRSVGDVPLKIDSVSLSDESHSDFKIMSTGLSLPLTLNPKEAKEISVTYAPSDESVHKGEIIVSSNDGRLPKVSLLLEVAAQ